MRIAIIGAGIAGLSAGRALQAAGIDSVVFDKGRGPGGRMVSKRTEYGAIDLGAQYFTARDGEFRAAVDEWQSAGVVAPWPVNPLVLPERQPARPETRLVAVPRMSALARHLADGLDVQSGIQVSEITRELSGWVLSGRHGESLGEFDALLLTAPAPQTQSLLAEPCPRLAARAAASRMQPCWSVGLVLERPLEVDFDAGFPSSGPLGWVARSGSRPDRPHLPEIWTLHATAAWSEANIEWSPEAVGEYLSTAFAELIRQTPSVTARIAHRWRFARARGALAESVGYLEHEDVLCAGDWVTDGRVEGAWRSGRAAARRLVNRLMERSGQGGG
ncbi:FAD-dependent oxidoreductase [Spiribacter sp. 221]|uniref:NAD(P)/FAD-dependent oxidoreductase n=1 Tax=Spiribacter onubensis TaxID=3122420 RepID=UPI00349F8CF2